MDCCFYHEQQRKKACWRRFFVLLELEREWILLDLLKVWFCLLEKHLYSLFVMVLVLVSAIFSASNCQAQFSMFANGSKKQAQLNAIAFSLLFANGGGGSISLNNHWRVLCVCADCSKCMLCCHELSLWTWLFNILSWLIDFSAFYVSLPTSINLAAGKKKKPIRRGAKITLYNVVTNIGNKYKIM